VQGGFRARRNSVVPAKHLATISQWAAQQAIRQNGANLKRSEAAKHQHEVSNPRVRETASGLLSADKTPEPDNWRHVQAAKQAGVSETTMGRVFALDAKRPDLVERAGI
jgi:hypothetical protein